MRGGGGRIFLPIFLLSHILFYLISFLLDHSCFGCYNLWCDFTGSGNFSSSNSSLDGWMVRLYQEEEEEVRNALQSVHLRKEKEGRGLDCNADES